MSTGGSNQQGVLKINVRRAGVRLGVFLLTGALAFAADWGHETRDTLVLTSTNGSPNNVVVFRLETSGTPSLSFVNMLPTGGTGNGAAGAGALQFSGEFGAVTNYGSNNVSQLIRIGDTINVARMIALAPNCIHPVSTALTGDHMFVAGSNCAESHAWPSGVPAGSRVTLPDISAAQIVAGETWAAVTLKSGSVLQLPLNGAGALSGTSKSVDLPSDANNTPLGAAFWGNVLGFLPAHSPDSFVLVNDSGNVFPVLGPQPAYPTNAPCWLAKGSGNIWYSGNSPAQAISIFFSDAQGGVFYKSVSVPGVPTDITVSPDHHWLAVIYTANSEGYVAVFSIDDYGDLTPVATSSSLGVSAFDGVAFSQ